MDNYFMKLAIREAKKGIGRTSPNPVVGAVVVRDGEIVGKGYHKYAGGAHAEVNALQSAGSLAKGSTIYVTLEPCNHQGRTPPCTRAILTSGIKRVVVGMPDPNTSVAGGGNDFLLSKGVDVDCGILEDECHKINRPFIKHVQQGLPWVILKAGISIDGKIAANSGQSSWITCDKSRGYVHRLRNNVDAILVGIATVEHDDPSLTTRLPNRKGRDPLRVILDTHLRFSENAKMLQQESSSANLIYCGPDCDQEKCAKLSHLGATIQKVPLGNDGHLDLQMVMKDLGKRDVNSLLVEGGGRVHASFIRQNIADQANIFIAPIFIGGDGISMVDELGLKSVKEASRLKEIKTRRFDNDIMIEGLFH
jgi:diaminohydroxyphosphoribosylaminopyrimidine deaminase/5-amino-6-(5-phosphoribosylamino)uracil reductase